VSFRGPGAQLLGRLATSISTPSLRAPLSARVHELRKTHMEAKDTEDLLCHAKLRTYALFTADVYLSMKLPVEASAARAAAGGGGGKSDGAKKEQKKEGKRDFTLGVGLMDILTERGKRNKDKENYKAISQSMKIAGSAIDADEKASNAEGATPKLDALMAAIHKLGTDDTNKSVSKYIKEMMTDIVDLRKNGWGIKQIKIPAQYLNQAENNSASAEATAAIPQHHLPYGGMAPHEVPADYQDFDFNGSNGDGSFDNDDNNLTAEEIAFMNEHMGGGNDQTPSGAPSDSEGGMNAEMEAAFEEFMLAQQKS